MASKALPRCYLTLNRFPGQVGTRGDRMARRTISELHPRGKTGYISRMSFVEALRALPLDGLVEHSLGAERAAVVAALAKPSLSLEDFAALLSPAAGDCL